MIPKLFESIARFAVRRPVVVLAVAAALTALSAWAAATRLPIRTSNLDLIDPHLPEVRKFMAFAEEFGTPNVMVVALEGDDEKALEAAVDQLGPRLRDLPGVRAVLDRLPLPTATVREAGIDPYLVSRDRNMFLLFVQPLDARSSADTIAPLVEATRSLLREANLDNAGIKAGLTGIPVYAIDDRDVIQRDLSVLSFIAFGLVAALFIVTFRSVRRPVLSLIVLVMGVVVTAGLVTLYPGHLTLLSAFFASTLFGLGVDYAIHIINRVEELISRGEDEAEAVSKAIGLQARELMTASTTTALGFFAMMFSGFRGFAELGFVAGVGVLVCLAAMISVLPALLALVRGRWHRIRPFEERKLGRLLFALQRPWIAGAALAVVVAGVLYGGPRFDSDYLNLEPADSEAVRLEREIGLRTDYSTQFAAFMVDSRTRADEIANRLMEEDDVVGEVRSIADVEALQDLAPDGAVLPDYFVQGFVSSNNRYAVYAYPRGNVWDPENQRAFTERMRAIDPDVSGMPFLGSFMVARSQRALYVTGALAGLMLLVSVFADLRRPIPVLLAVAPTLLTVLALRGLMKLTGIDLNPLNVMALPIVIGVAIDNGVYLVHRFRTEQGDLFRTLAGTGRSIVMTSATTMAGFGSLVFTSHRGLASFGATLALGVAVSMALSLLVLPGVLRAARHRLVGDP
jgi:predicted RND superfamily exporter protein